MDADLKKRLNFIMEMDKMKNIYRLSLLHDFSRRETDAEHSWHIALMAYILKDYAFSDEIDIDRVIKMLLVHDLVEIYAGDTPAYDIQGNLDKKERELKAANQVFSMLPKDQGAELRSLWEEFEAMATPDAIFAASLDRLQPLLGNSVTHGHSWRIYHATKEDVYKRMNIIQRGIPALWPVVVSIINEFTENGAIQE